MKRILTNIVRDIFHYILKLFGWKKKERHVSNLRIKEDPIEQKISRRQQRLMKYQESKYSLGYYFASFKSGLRKKMTRLLVKFK